MRAWVYECPSDSDTGCAGTGRITPEYKSLETMRRYYFKKRLRSGATRSAFYRVEIHNNWDTRYGLPDKVLRIEVKIDGGFVVHSLG